jgi:hypothetical protein
MKVPHTTPEVIQVYLPEHQVVLSFESDVGAEAFSDWWSYDGGSEVFAAWVQTQQIREGRFPNLVIEDSNIISWDDGE